MVTLMGELFWSSHVLRLAILNHVASFAAIAPASYERYAAQSPTWAAVNDHVMSRVPPEATVTAGAEPVDWRQENAAALTPPPIGAFWTWLALLWCVKVGEDSCVSRSLQKASVTLSLQRQP